ncbi:16S rRNA (uracil(1498)-N(3))-methyltransferase [candidate division KSB1 bacterium]|nr:16S rRNA (uracil(1498)-N(3))-methyltransferase [candidate division KSB1 bacterium]
MKHKEFYYIPPEQIMEDRVIIKGAEFKHITIVTRKRPRDTIHVVDGMGNEYLVTLTKIDRKSAEGKIFKRSRYTGEPNFQLTLAQAIPKGTRFELLLEKCTEIGVSEFIPLITEKTVMKQSDAREIRWKNITIAALKQCGRSVLPRIFPPITLHELIRSSKIYDFRLIAHQDSGSLSLIDSINEANVKLSGLTRFKNGIIAIGPEAGFSEEEIALAKSNFYVPFNLGDRRLRSETAGIVSCAIMMEFVEHSILFQKNQLSSKK